MIAAPFGSVAVQVRGKLLWRIDLCPEAAARVAPVDAISAAVCEQLEHYFADARFRFDVPLTPGSTRFREQVRAALRAIPPGEVRAYGEVAASIGSSARAVGGACRDNPLPLVVPCHRVVARHGRGGFMGATSGPELDIKTWLLRHEQDCCPHAGRLL